MCCHGYDDRPAVKGGGLFLSLSILLFPNYYYIILTILTHNHFTSIDKNRAPWYTFRPWHHP
jgi:hypothetical protein